MHADKRVQQETFDRSVPRARVAAGDLATDRRGRRRSAPAFLSDGFRPFFFLGALYAALAIPLWLWIYSSGAAMNGPFQGAAWHAHEMIFGYLAAVMTGFVLTAVPNWTGRLPLSGTPLALLVAAWLAGRVACATIASPVTAMIIDMLFPTALSIAVWREVIAGRNWRNAPIGFLLSLFAAANLLHHLGQMKPALGDVAIRLALGVAAMMIALIGGRIVPSFTRNWLAKRNHTRLPASFDTLDRLTLIVVATAVSAWIVVPVREATGLLLAGAGLLLLMRLSRWRGTAIWREPIVLILHIGYLWLAAAFLLLGLSNVDPAVIPDTAALHALTAGAIATMTLAVMTRASLGHTGRAIRADVFTVAIYALVTAGALLRVAAPLFPAFTMELLTAGGVFWSLSFGLFAASYGPMLFRSKINR